MKQKEFEKLMENCADLIEERSNLAVKKIYKNNTYKEKYQKYSNLYEELVNKLGKDEIEIFTSAIYSLNDMENDYIYMQGFVDGMLLRENLANNS